MALTPREIKRRIEDLGYDSVAQLAREWGETEWTLSAVINRNSRIVRQDMRERIAALIKVPVSEVGRDALRETSTGSKAVA